MNVGVFFKFLLVKVTSSSSTLGRLYGRVSPGGGLRDIGVVFSWKFVGKEGVSQCEFEKTEVW